LHLEWSVVLETICMSRSPQSPPSETGGLRTASAESVFDDRDVDAGSVVNAPQPDDEEKATPRLEAAADIALMRSELGTMAKGAELTLLSYFLEMATIVARKWSTNLARMMGLPQLRAHQADQARA
jgi:hypothetical protein